MRTPGHTGGQAHPALHIHTPGALVPELREAQAVCANTPTVPLHSSLFRRDPGARQQPALRRPNRGARRRAHGQGARDVLAVVRLVHQCRHADRGRCRCR